MSLFSEEVDEQSCKGGQLFAKVRRGEASGNQSIPASVMPGAVEGRANVMPQAPT